MKVVTIGAGRVGAQLHRGLKAAGHDALLVHGRGGEVPTGADAYVIAVRDDVLPQVAQRVSEVAGSAVVLHTAGSVSMDVTPHAQRGVLYPMQTFSAEREVDWSVVPLFIEASTEEALATTRALAESLSSHVTVLTSDQRRSLHVAAVFACNFVNHCLTLADTELHRIGLDWHTMLPLLDETVAKLHHLSPLEAQTGPAVRGDETTMAEHRRMIENDLTRDIYKMMSDSIKRSKTIIS